MVVSRHYKPYIAPKQYSFRVTIRNLDDSIHSYGANTLIDACNLVELHRLHHPARSVPLSWFISYEHSGIVVNRGLFRDGAITA